MAIFARLLDPMSDPPLPANSIRLRGDAKRYGLALLFTLLAVAFVELAPFLRTAPFIVMVSAVALSAWYAGFGPALFSAALSIVLIDFFVLEPRFSLGLATTRDYVRIGEFFFVSLLVAQLARQRFRAERAERDVRQRLAAIVEGSEDSILSKDRKGIITSWNAAAERLYGYTPQEVIGRHVSILAPPEKADEIDLIMARILRGEQVGHLQTERIRKDGTRLTVWLSVSPIRDENGIIIGASALTHDVTAQVHVEKRLSGTQRELAAAYERLQLAQQAARVGAWEWNMDTGTVTWSPELERIHGFPLGSFGGTFEDWLQTVHPEDRDVVRKQVLASVQQGGQYDIEYRSVRPDGSVYWTAARGKVFYDPDGRPQRLAGVCMDIDQRKADEENMKQTEKLAATGRLAASIAHEINNPLESVVNLVYLAQLDPSLSLAGRQYLALADKELGRVAHLAKQTLGFYRDSSVPVRLRVSHVLDEVLELYARRLESKEIVATKNYSGESEITAFEGEIRQLFSNLITNAIDALPPYGQLRIRVCRASDWRDSGRPGVRVTVADSGTGIPQELRGKIFEPFFTTKKDVGTGLGLWLSRSIVEKHGGYIRVRSSAAPGHSGAVFTVFLPQASEARSEMTSAA
jgi:PAS domain S-box-containing protein